MIIACDKTFYKLHFCKNIISWKAMIVAYGNRDLGDMQ